MQDTLRHELARALTTHGIQKELAEAACNVHSEAKKVPKGAQISCNNATLLDGHQAVGREIGDASHVVWPGATRNDTLLVSIFREPESRVESGFRFHGGKGKAFVKEVQQRGIDLQAQFEAHERHVTSFAKNKFARNSNPIQRGTPFPGPYQAAWFHAPPSLVHMDVGRNMSDRQFMVVTKEFIADRYNVVGVLDRMQETLEVMRCRVPWFNARQMKVDPRTAQNWQYPVKLEHAPILKEVTKNELELYKLANAILTADVQCCRDHAPA
jgi:hypothetical protein